ncbi:hypothetical protein OG205_41880 [Lentzea sp. NBC_00516]|uniref:hypothetical protein n=1 Tax=Lentzea sp. NBC_00516 TaxID=2903582 RepID=UPI002E813A1A|nr:hypothetical protein [Lentzea sp. NBC_00516]WUD24522.1 hypothetical protein OG205_41880 [Lentzea sp. NBC_00516]
MGAAVLITGVLVAPTAAQAETGCEWIRTDLPIPAGQSSIGTLAGAGDWLASTTWGQSVVVWHQEVPETVTFPVQRSSVDINRNGVLLSAGEDGRWRGEEKLGELPGRSSTVHSINADGEVVGKSGGALAVWPAGVALPRLLEGTDDGRSWWTEGIDDAGNVVGGVGGDGPQRYYVWNRQGERVELQPLEGHYQVFPSLIRDGRVYGASAVEGDYRGISVEWNLRGEIVRTLPGGAVLAANDAGDEMSRWESGAAVQRADGRVDPLPHDVFPDVLAENGDVFGGLYFAGPVKLRCA